MVEESATKHNYVFSTEEKFQRESYSFIYSFRSKISEFLEKLKKIFPRYWYILVGQIPVETFS